MDIKNMPIGQLTKELCAYSDTKDVREKAMGIIMVLGHRYHNNNNFNFTLAFLLGSANEIISSFSESEISATQTYHALETMCESILSFKNDYEHWPLIESFAFCCEEIRTKISNNINH